MRMIELAGCEVPVLGQGTWHIGGSAQRHYAEVEALRQGIDLGMTLVDTAEMYESGRSERLVGEAVAGRRDDVFLVSKVLPSNASRIGVVRACEASLRRLGTDRLDLYLLHWKGSYPLEETIAGFEELRRQGKIRAWGVSNFDRADIVAMPGAMAAGGQPRPAADQVLYNLRQRWPEAGLVHELRARAIPLMAYSPLERGELAAGSRRSGAGRSRGASAQALVRVAERHGVSAAQVALAWLISHLGVIAIPEAGSPAHAHENAAAANLELAPEDLAELDTAFPPPGGTAPMQMH